MCVDEKHVVKMKKTFVDDSETHVDKTHVDKTRAYEAHVDKTHAYKYYVDKGLS